MGSKILGMWVLSFLLIKVATTYKEKNLKVGNANFYDCRETYRVDLTNFQSNESINEDQALEEILKAQLVKIDFWKSPFPSKRLSEHSKLMCKGLEKFCNQIIPHQKLYQFFWGIPGSGLNLKQLEHYYVWRGHSELSFNLTDELCSE